MNIESVLTKTTLGVETSIALTSFKSIYAIAIKDKAIKKSKSVVIPAEKIKRINFEVRIDTGVDETILVDSFSIEFENEENKIAYRNLNHILTHFSVKPVAFYTYDNEKITEGETNIALNFNVQ